MAAQIPEQNAASASMATLLLTHPSFVEHDTGPGHPERADRMRKAIA